LLAPFYSKYLTYLIRGSFIVILKKNRTRSSFLHSNRIYFGESIFIINYTGTICAITDMFNNIKPPKENPNKLDWQYCQTIHPEFNEVKNKYIYCNYCGPDTWPCVANILFFPAQLQ